jgi:hypothetical protein
MIDIEPAIANRLDEMVPSYSDAIPDWGDVLRRAPSDHRTGRLRKPTRRRVVAATAFVLGVGAATAILLHIPSANRGIGNGSGGCALRVQFRGTIYSGRTVEIVPERGPRVGSAVIPDCGPGGGPQTIQVARLRGVSPNVALVWVGSNDTILVRNGANRLPTAVTRLFTAPTCRRRDAPIHLAGPWLGILAANGRTELTMRPPYDLEILAARATPSRYRRALLTIRVPASLGRPLTEQDIHSVLDKGGSITITATCGDGRYLAQQVRARPPN